MDRDKGEKGVKTRKRISGQVVKMSRSLIYVSLDLNHHSLCLVEET